MGIINDIDALDYCMISNVKRLSQLVRERMPGYTLYLGETRRELSTQMAYYSRGRAPIEVVKAYFKACGLWKLTDAEAQTKSTETLDSKHMKGLAIDAYLMKDGKILWNPDKALWDQLFALAEDECGLDACAGRKWNAWQWDMPHFEYKSPI